MEGPYNPHLLFYGQLKDDLGQSVEGAQVQFWHADYHGNYYHPGDDLDGKELMSDSFSYFGTATTDNAGSFEFKTYRPGIYVSRPVTHIHFKVFYEGREILTSQFYFADENVQEWFDDMLILTLEETIDDDGNVLHHSSKEVVVNMNNGGYNKLTPTQVEGPFYPLVNFFNFSSDMTLGLPERFDDDDLIDEGTSTDNPTSTSQPSSEESTLIVSSTSRPTSHTGLGTSHTGLGGPEINNIEDFVVFLEEGNGIATIYGNHTLSLGNDTDADHDEEASIDILLDGNATIDGNYTLSLGNDTDADHDVEAFIDILLDDELSINGDGSDGDDDGISASRDFEALPPIDGNSTSNFHQVKNALTLPPTGTPTTNPTDGQNEPEKHSNNKKEDQEKPKTGVDNRDPKEENFVSTFIDATLSKFIVHTENAEQHKGEDSNSASSDDGMRFLRSRK